MHHLSQGKPDSSLSMVRATAALDAARNGDQHAAAARRTLTKSRPMCSMSHRPTRLLSAIFGSPPTNSIQRRHLFVVTTHQLTAPLSTAPARRPMSFTRYLQTTRLNALSRPRRSYTTHGAPAPKSAHSTLYSSTFPAMIPVFLLGSAVYLVCRLARHNMSAPSSIAHSLTSA